MEAAYSSETSTSVHKITRCHNLKDFSLKKCRHRANNSVFIISKTTKLKLNIIGKNTCSRFNRIAFKELRSKYIQKHGQIWTQVLPYNWNFVSKRMQTQISWKSVYRFWNSFLRTDGWTEEQRQFNKRPARVKTHLKGRIRGGFIFLCVNAWVVKNMKSLDIFTNANCWQPVFH